MVAEVKSLIMSDSLTCPERDSGVFLAPYSIVNLIPELLPEKRGGGRSDESGRITASV